MAITKSLGHKKVAWKVYRVTYSYEDRLGFFKVVIMGKSLSKAVSAFERDKGPNVIVNKVEIKKVHNVEQW